MERSAAVAAMTVTHTRGLAYTINTLWFFAGDAVSNLYHMD